MKPTWNTAPGWAQYLAMDQDGEWFWHEHEPYTAEEEWLSEGRCERVLGNWDESLEPRPTTTEE